ncbi:autotransporter-associated beta strand repeat-containing protein, partial [Pirellulales bacterium]|nr:autotransporter-associated beta strand repeat-containing protein [Pirellulales bacterium]
YSGSFTTVNAAGTLKLGTGNTLPDLTRVTLSVSGARLDLDNANEEIGGLSSVAGSQVILGAATLTTGSNNETLNFDGNITGAGGLTKVGNGTQKLRAVNSFTGDINVNDGTLEIGQSNTIGNNAVIVANGATLRVAGNAESFGSLAGAGTVNSTVNTSVGVNPGHNNTSTTFSGNITGIGPFVKSGAGTMTMTGISDYTGRTRIDNGTLEFDGASAELTQTNGIVLNGGNVTVRNGASLNSVGSNGFINLDALTSSLTIESGGSATSALHTSIGEVAGSLAQVFVTGVGSKLETLGTSRVRVGNIGAGSLDVFNGGQVVTDLLAIADSSSNPVINSAARVDGFLNNGLNGIFGDDDDEVSRVTSRRGLFVGDVDTGFLIIENGGRVVSGTGSSNHAANKSFVGFSAAADGSTATITGDKARWVHKGHIQVAGSAGNADAPVELQVLDGGYAEFSFLEASASDGSRSKITVDGTGSMLKLRDARADPGVVSPGFGDIRMVASGSNGISEIFVTDGGLVDIDTRLAIGQGTADFGGEAHVTVDGAGSTLDVGNELIVALAGTTASLTITDGGAVNSGADDTVVSPVRDSFISHTSGTGTANVGAEAGMDTGHAEASWNIDGNLYIAGNQASDNNGNAGVLNINPTGRVSVAGQVRVWDTGAINLNGGVLEVDSIDLTDDVANGAVPTLNFNSGTLRFTTTPEATLGAAQLSQVLGGNPTLTTGQELAVDNTAILAAPLRNNGGTFSVGEMDAASAANLDFDAGTVNLTKIDLSVGTGGIFGSTVIIDPEQTINVTQNVTVEADGRLVVAGGFSSALLTNSNELVAIDTAINGPVDTTTGSTV